LRIQKRKWIKPMLAGATGLEPATFGVTGQPFFPEKSKGRSDIFALEAHWIP
jgi:hypothetical protein